MKTLIFGPANAGKTSLLRTTCDGYSFMRVINLPPTRGVSRENYLFRGLLELSIWDAGGQKKYHDHYFNERDEIIFSDVKIPIFMVDSSVHTPENAEIFHKFLEKIQEFSPEVENIYILLNKTDLKNADPDGVYHELIEGLDENILKKCKFTPVSVKLGTAQHRLIEILDENLEKSVLELEKLGNLRRILDSMRQESAAHYFLINKRDGLIITSTLGKIKSDPLNYVSLDVSLTESNIRDVYSTIQERLNREQQPLFLKSIIYETQSQYVLLQEVDDFTELLILIDGKDPQKLIQIFLQTSPESDQMKELSKILETR